MVLSPQSTEVSMEKARTILQGAINLKNMFNSFLNKKQLNTLDSDELLSINNFIFKSIREIEQRQSDDYVYWFDSITSWETIYKKSLISSLETELEKACLTSGNLDINYLYINSSIDVYEYIYFFYERLYELDTTIDMSNITSEYIRSLDDEEIEIRLDEIKNYLTSKGITIDIEEYSRKNILDKVKYIFDIFNQGKKPKSNLENKIIYVYNKIVDLQHELRKLGIETDIILTNFSINDGDIIFDYISNRPFYKEPFFNIKLLFKSYSGMTGGVHQKRKQTNLKKRDEKFKRLQKQVKEQITEEQITEEQITEEQITEEQITTQEELYITFLSNTSKFADKIIVEINFEKYRKPSEKKPAEPKELINYFREKYIVSHPIREVNVLSKIGMLTHSYLYMSDKLQEMGINVNEIRQKYFYRIVCENNVECIKNVLNYIIEIYNEFNKDRFASYNNFFMEKIEKILLEKTVPNYDLVMNFIERWFISLFRPSINSFIIELNEQLEAEGIDKKLFIAGGDAMRRYENEISFTNDIDTKLYIGENISPTEKQNIIDIIAVNIVKLRNFLEENFKSFLQNITLQYNDKSKNLNEIKLDYSNKPIIINLENFKGYIYLKLNESRQQFRVREIKKSEEFPVDLYSIDFQTKIVYSLKENDFIHKYIDISILDVVVQSEKYEKYYSDDKEGLRIASLDFLIEDLEKTYRTDDRALARISSGKYKKDINRYNILKKLKEEEKKPLSTIKEKLYKSLSIPKKGYLNTLTYKQKLLFLEAFKTIMDIKTAHYTELKKYIEENETISEYEKKIFYIFLYKIENKIPFTIFDIIITALLVKRGILNIKRDDNIIIENTKRILLELAKKISFFEINIYGENINKNNLSKYRNYEIDDKTNDIYHFYYELFKKLIDKDDLLKKHTIPFIDRLIRSSFTKEGIDYKSFNESQPKPMGQPKPRRLKKPATTSIQARTSRTSAKKTSRTTARSQRAARKPAIAARKPSQVLSPISSSSSSSSPIAIPVKTTRTRAARSTT